MEKEYVVELSVHFVSKREISEEEVVLAIFKALTELEPDSCTAIAPITNNE
jgi:hypothetical protein